MICSSKSVTHYAYIKYDNNIFLVLESPWKLASRRCMNWSHVHWTVVHIRNWLMPHDYSKAKSGIAHYIELWETLRPSLFLCSPLSLLSPLSLSLSPSLSLTLALLYPDREKTKNCTAWETQYWLAQLPLIWPLHGVINFKVRKATQPL